MSRMPKWMLLGAAVALAEPILELNGEGARIEFIDAHYGKTAKLSATCTPTTAAWKSLAPQSIQADNATLTVELAHVEPSCSNVPIDQPCAPGPAMQPFIRALFFVDVRGASGSVSLGPLHAVNEAIPLEATGKHAGLSTRLSVPFVTIEQLLTLVQYSGQGETVNVTISVSFATTPEGLVPSASGLRTPLPFQGFAGDDVVQVYNLPQPPSPPSLPPPSLPPSPPSAPPQQPLGGTASAPFNGLCADLPPPTQSLPRVN